MNKYLRLISGVLIGVIMAPFTACQAHTCSFTQKVESAVYLKEEATCQNRSEYYYSCTCGKQGEDYFFGPRAEHVYTEKVDSEYLLTQANVLNAAVYFKSCIWCEKKGKETFSYGEPLSYEGAMEAYAPMSLTITLYDAENSIYGFTYNTSVKPLRPVIQIQKGSELTDECQEYAASVTEEMSYTSNGLAFTYYIVKTAVPLEQQTTYTYRAYDKDACIGTEAVTLVTKNTKSNSFTFVHASDSQNSPTHFAEVLKNTVDSTDFILHGGDIVEWSKYEQEWEAMLHSNFQYLSKVPMMAISGNHETAYQCGSNEIFKHFHNKMPTQNSTQKGYYYSFIYGNTKFIMLNNSHRIEGVKFFGDEQYAWLVNELENNTCQWTVVAIHVPMFSVGKNGSSEEVLALREQLQGVFAKYGVDIVLQGHDHTVSRTFPINEQGKPQKETWRDMDGVGYSVNPNGTIYLMNGVAGNQHRGVSKMDASLYHYGEGSNDASWAEFEINENVMKVSVKYSTGTEIKTYQSWGIVKE